jgi:hypothetical protein
LLSRVVGRRDLSHCLVVLCINSLSLNLVYTRMCCGNVLSEEVGIVSMAWENLLFEVSNTTLSTMKAYTYPTCNAILMCAFTHLFLTVILAVSFFLNFHTRALPAYCNQ